MTYTACIIFSRTCTWRLQGHDRLFAKLTEDVKRLRFPFRPVVAGADGATATPAADVSASSAAATGGAASSSSAAAGSGASAAADGATKTVTVVKLARGGGVVERSREYRREARRARIREYFYGPYRPVGVLPALQPDSATVSFDDVIIVRVGGMEVRLSATAGGCGVASVRAVLLVVCQHPLALCLRWLQSEAGILPIGKASALDPLRVTQLPPAPSLVQNILAVSFATAEKQVPHVPVAGFVHV